MAKIKIDKRKTTTSGYMVSERMSFAGRKDEWIVKDVGTFVKVINDIKKGPTKSTVKVGETTVGSLRVRPQDWKINRVKHGVNPDKVTKLLQTMGYTKAGAARILGMSPATLYRKKTLKNMEAFLALNVADLMDWGMIVFGNNIEGFYEWLWSPLPVLGDERPADFLSRPGGVEHIRDLLQDIYGGGY